MNKQIQNILYAAHCLGICSDWSEQAVNAIIDAFKDDTFVYNKSMTQEEFKDFVSFEMGVSPTPECLDGMWLMYNWMLKRLFDKTPQLPSPSYTYYTSYCDPDGIISGTTTLKSGTYSLID